MATHELSLSIPSGEIHNADVIVTVHSDGVKLGELRVSRGTIDWKPRKHPSWISLEWEAFDRQMRETERWVR